MHSAVQIYIQLQVTLYSVPGIAGRFFVAPGRGFVLMKIRAVAPDPPDPINHVCSLTGK